MNYFIEVSVYGIGELKPGRGRKIVSKPKLGDYEFDHENVDFAHIQRNVFLELLPLHPDERDKGLGGHNIRVPFKIDVAETGSIDNPFPARKGAIAIGTQVIRVKKGWEGLVGAAAEAIAQQDSLAVAAEWRVELVNAEDRRQIPGRLELCLIPVQPRTHVRHRPSGSE